MSPIAYRMVEKLLSSLVGKKLEDLTSDSVG